MAARSIMDRLNAGDVLLMDGATGSELGRRGVNVSKGSTMEDLAVWSGSANIDAPNVVRQVHEEYLRLGADIIISNNFWTSRPKLETIGEADNWEEYTRAGGEIAIQARDNVNSEAYVAGGVAPPDRDVRREFEDQSRVLADVGVDLMLPEYVGTIKNAVIAVDACATVDLPVLLGICHLDNDGVMEIKGEKLADLAKALRGHPVDMILLMCSFPEGITAGLPQLQDAFDGMVGVYPNIGYGKNPNFGKSRTEQWHTIDTSGYPPESMAEFAQQWIEMGAQIVGGCCAAGPEHIEAMAPVVKAA